MNSATLIAKASVGDDRVYRETRWLAWVVVPILFAAFLILYPVPELNGQLFAWTITSPMTAMMLGATYFGGVYFFVQSLRSSRWHWFGNGLLAVTYFAFVLGLTTLLHWDRFHQGHPSFFLWAFLYLTLPFVIPLVWWRNRRTDSLKLDAHDAYLESWARFILIVLGVVEVAASLFLFFAALSAPSWPWALTPLTARVISAMFGLPGISCLLIAYDRRWSAARILVEAQLVSIILILVAVARAANEFDPLLLVTWTFVGGLAVHLLILLVLYARYRRWSAKG